MWLDRTPPAPGMATGPAARSTTASAVMALSLANSDASLIDDPKTTSGGLDLQKREETTPRTKNGALVGDWQPQNNQAGRLGGRIGPDVGKAKVKSDEYTSLALADGDQLRVRDAPEALVGDAQCIVPVLDQKLGEIGREILICFEFHAASSLGSEKTRSLARAAA